MTPFIEQLHSMRVEHNSYYLVCRGIEHNFYYLVCRGIEHDFYYLVCRGREHNSYYLVCRGREHNSYYLVCRWREHNSYYLLCKGREHNSHYLPCEWKGYWGDEWDVVQTHSTVFASYSFGPWLPPCWAELKQENTTLMMVYDGLTAVTYKLTAIIRFNKITGW